MLFNLNESEQNLKKRTSNILRLVKAETLATEMKCQDFRFGDSCLSQITALQHAITYRIACILQNKYQMFVYRICRKLNVK